MRWVGDERAEILTVSEGPPPTSDDAAWPCRRCTRYRPFSHLRRTRVRRREQHDAVPEHVVLCLTCLEDLEVPAGSR